MIFSACQWHDNFSWMAGREESNVNSHVRTRYYPLPVQPSALHNAHYGPCIIYATGRIKMSFGYVTFFLLLGTYMVFGIPAIINIYRLKKQRFKAKTTENYRLWYLGNCIRTLDGFAGKRSDYDLGFKDGLQMGLNLFSGKEIDVQLRSEYQGRTIRIKHSPRLNEPPA